MYHNGTLLLSGLDTASAIDTTYVVSYGVAKIDAAVVDKYLCPGKWMRESCLPVSILALENFYEGNAEKCEPGMMQEF
jgi:hypothetical protein